MDFAALNFRFVRLALPIIVGCAGLTTIYSVLNWYLVAGTGTVPLDQEVADFWLPLVLSFALAFYLIHRPLKVLRLGKDERGNVLYEFLATAVIAAPLIVAQYYVEHAAGTLTRLNDLFEIGSAPVTRFYEANHVCFDRHHAVAHTVFASEGKNNENFVFKIYVLVPLCVEEPGPNIVWLGKLYRSSIDNRTSVSEKQAHLRQFASESQKTFDAEDFSRSRFFERARPGIDLHNFEKILAKQSPGAALVVLIGHEEAFEARAGNSFAWIFRCFAGGALAWLLLVNLPRIDRARLDAYSVAGPKIHAKENIWRAMLLPSPGHYGLSVLMDINIGVYAAMVLSGLGVASFQIDDLIAWGASFPPLNHDTGLTRLITSQFVHGGLMHLVQNLYGLLFAGLFLAPVMRNWGLVLCYLVCGVVAAVASMHVHPNVVGMGASGAVMGLFGIAIALVILRDRRLSGAGVFILANTGIFVGLTLLIGAINPGIDNIAHIAGLGAGAAIGLALAIHHRIIAPGAPDLADKSGPIDMRY